MMEAEHVGRRTVSRGEKLLIRMRASKADWSVGEALTVYRWAGFTVREGARHIVVQHPDFPWLAATITRSSPLPTGYIQALLELVARAEECRKGAP
jgi:hypothetical protein